MRKIIVILLCLIIPLNVFSNVEKLLKYSELFLSHDTRNGYTELILYNVTGGKDFVHQIKKSEFIKSNYDLKNYDLVSESYSDSKDMLSVRIFLKAKNPLMHQKNLEEILSQIIVKEVKVRDLDIVPMSKYVIGIFIDETPGMYNPTGNSIGIYQSPESNQIIYQFDIANKPIEFLIGFKEL